MYEYKTKEYHQRKAKEHYWKNKDAYNTRCKIQRDRTKTLIEEAKKHGCIKCGENTIVCLDFHHTKDKDRIISQMRGMNDDRVKVEISKCVVLCANCHRKYHAGLIEI